MINIDFKALTLSEWPNLRSWNIVFALYSLQAILRKRENVIWEIGTVE